MEITAGREFTSNFFSWAFVYNLLLQKPFIFWVDKNMNKNKRHISVNQRKITYIFVCLLLDILYRNLYYTVHFYLQNQKLKKRKQNASVNFLGLFQIFHELLNIQHI